MKTHLSVALVDLLLNAAIVPCDKCSQINNCN